MIGAGSFHRSKGRTMTVSIWQARGSEPVRDVDMLIIGAGLAGSAAAFFAAQAGREVVVTDTRGIALGASSRNAGFMITGPDTYYHRAIAEYGHAGARTLWALSARTHAHWYMLAAAGEAAGAPPVPFDRSGSFLLAESPEEARELEQAARALNADGIEAIYHARDPFDRGYHAAIEQPWDAGVQPYALAHAAFAASGAELVSENEVYALEERDGVVWVHTRKFRFRARHVLLCTNAYSAALHPYFAGKVIPTRAQCLVTAPLSEPVFRGCGYSDYGYMYYRMTFDNRLLIGGGRKTFKAQENDTTDDRLNPQVQAVLDAYLARHFPDVDAPVERRWAGIMGFSVDGLPLVGTLPGMPHVGFAVGFTGHGLAFGAATAECAVAHLLDGAPAGILDARRLEGVRAAAG
jgi:glycine/D-amino acid oxidase-like deaminating enzyme